jgi:hypothetical protein
MDDGGAVVRAGRGVVRQEGRTRPRTHAGRQTDYEKPPEFDRGLNQTEIDSLRAMKITHRITRDEYWDGKGGVVANDRVEVWYSNRKIYILQAMAVVKQMDQVASQIQKSFGKLPPEKLVVVCAPDLETFRTVTGRDWWHYSLIKSDTLSMQTPMTLYMRGLLQVAARREYSRWALGHFTNGKAPQWVVWGMAGYLGNERDVFRGQRKEYGKLTVRMELADVEKALASESDRIETRRAMYNAYLMVNELVEKNGMPSEAAFILALGEEASADAAAQRAFSKSYDDVLAQAQAFAEPPVEADSVAPAPAGDDHAGEK